jgi:hypothetical protein
MLKCLVKSRCSGFMEMLHRTYEPKKVPPGHNVHRRDRINGFTEAILLRL